MTQKPMQNEENSKILRAPMLPIPTKAQNPFSFSGQDLVFKNPWFSLIEKPFTINMGPGLGKTGAYGIIQFALHGVGILPIHANGDISLIAQYRVPLERFTWEAIKGGADRGEDLAQGARRELAEETGMAANILWPIPTMVMSASITDEVHQAFLGFDITEGQELHPDDTESIEGLKIPFSAAMQALDNGEIEDAITVSLLLYLARFVGLRAQYGDEWGAFLPPSIKNLPAAHLKKVEIALDSAYMSANEKLFTQLSNLSAASLSQAGQELK